MRNTAQEALLSDQQSLLSSLPANVLFLARSVVLWLLALAILVRARVEFQVVLVFQFVSLICLRFSGLCANCATVHVWISTGLCLEHLRNGPNIIEYQVYGLWPMA